MEFSIYTDGGCSGNKRNAGCNGAWAYIILDPAKNEISSKRDIVTNTTNNRMELTAVIEGLKDLIKLLKESYDGASNNNCIVITDSRYVSDNFTEYSEEWKRNGWRKSSGGGVINSDLWKELCRLTPEFKSFKFQWVKGHSTCKFNIHVDESLRDLLTNQPKERAVL